MPIFREHPGLLEDFRAGQPHALEAVYWRYVNVVAKVIREGMLLSQMRRVTGASYSARADLVQETFLRAFKPTARSAFDGQRLYQPYLLTICRNILIDWTRKQGREISHDAVECLGKFDDAPQEEPDGNWVDDATVGIVERYVRTLDPVLRDVYEARYVLCLSQNEAAQRLSLTRQRLRTIENRLREGLRQALENG